MFTDVDYLHPACVIVMHFGSIVRRRGVDHHSFIIAERMLSGIHITYVGILVLTRRASQIGQTSTSQHGQEIPCGLDHDSHNHVTATTWSARCTAATRGRIDTWCIIRRSPRITLLNILCYHRAPCYPTNLRASLIKHHIIMGRWTDMDDVYTPSAHTYLAHTDMSSQDSQRLPEGMQRIGYDADTQSYIFRDVDGATYTSAPGARYGELTRVSSSSSSLSTHEYDLSNAPARTFEEMEERKRVVDKGNREAVRMMLPFALLVLVFMFLLFKLVGGGAWADGAPKQVLDCGQGSHQIEVDKGDTCWEIARDHGLGVEDLLALRGNERVVCERLRIGMGICVKDAKRANV